MDKSKNPLISVIIPVKNNPVGITLLLESLKKQTLSKNQFEIIVVDNGSTDHTREVIEQFSVKLFTKKTPGSYSARNLGIKKAKGRYVVFTDSDCITSPKWLESGVKVLSLRDTSIVAGHVKFIFRKLFLTPIT